MDVFDLLRQDHRVMDDLLRRICRPAGAADFDHSGRLYLLDRLTVVASRHEAAEEITFWPHVRQRLSDGDRLADRGLRAERDVKAYLDLLGVERSDEDIAAQAGQLRRLLGDHIRFEESEVFPAMHRCSTPVWRALSALRYRLALRAAPTRPHPDGPDTPLGFMTVGAPALVLDHLRDLRNSRRRHPEGFEHPDHLDAVAVVKEDHSRIRDRLALIDSQDDPDDTLVHETIRLLAVHDSIERQYLYPMVRLRVVDGNEVYSHLISDHGEMAAQAAKIDSYRFHDQARKEWLGELADTTRSHMEWEEDTVLACLSERLTGEELTVLGCQLASARQHAPTRPHPHIAGVGAGARLSRRLAGPLDKTRDALGRRAASQDPTDSDRSCAATAPACPGPK